MNLIRAEILDQNENIVRIRIAGDVHFQPGDEVVVQSHDEPSDAARVFEGLNKPMTEEEKAYWSKVAEEQFGFMEPFRQEIDPNISHEWADIKKSIDKGKAEQYGKQK